MKDDEDRKHVTSLNDYPTTVDIRPIIGDVEQKLKNFVEIEYSVDLYDDLVYWLNNNTQEQAIYITPYGTNKMRVYFNNDEDAFLFKLTWG